MTLADGKTFGVPYPKRGYNCTAEWSLAQKVGRSIPEDLEPCKSYSDRFTMGEGRVQ
jgi:hypothetical protein